MPEDLTKNPTWREGGVAGALAYLTISATTEWLAVLPTVPEGQMTEYTVAVGTILAGIGRAIKWCYRARLIPAIKPKE